MAEDVLSEAQVVLDYKNHFENEIRRNRRVDDFLDFLEEKDLFDRRLWTIYSSDWRSKLDTDGVLILGTAPMPDEEKEIRFYKPENYSEIDILQHKFIHELTHKLIPFIRLDYDDEELSDRFDEVYKKLVSVRKVDNKKGLSVLASQGVYLSKGVNMQAIEDMVELITMYIIDPEKFEDFFENVIDSEDMDVRQRFGIADIDKETSVIIKENITFVIDSLLEGFNHSK